MRVCIPVNSIHCIFWLLTICDFWLTLSFHRSRKPSCLKIAQLKENQWKFLNLKKFTENRDFNPRLKMVESVLGNWDDWFLSPLFFGSFVMHIASRQTQLITGLPQAILSYVLQRIRRGLQSETYERHFLMEGSSWLGKWGGGEHSIC